MKNTKIEQLRKVFQTVDAAFGLVMAMQQIWGGKVEHKIITAHFNIQQVLNELNKNKPDIKVVENIISKMIDDTE